MQELTLDEVAEAFEKWRLRRRSKSTPIPTRLWGLVGNIQNHYSRSTIYRRLRISSLQFRRNVEIGDSAPTIGTEDFVEAVSDQVLTVQKITISLKSVNHTLTLSLAPEQIANVLPHFRSLL